VFGGRFSSSYGVLGVDIGSRAIRMLQLRRCGVELHVVGAAEEPFDGSPIASDDEPAALASGRSKHAGPSQLAESLRAALAAGGFTGRRCVVSLPRNDLHVQAVRLPTMPDADLHQAAVWEAAERFGLDPKSCEVDIVRTGGVMNPGGTPGSTGEPREEILLVAASHAVIKARLKPILDAGLHPIAIDTHFGALARIFSARYRRESDRQHVRLIVEVGAAGSTVMILRGDEIAFCKPVPIAGQQFTKAVAEHLQLDLTTAAELRDARILANTLASRSAVPQSERSAADEATDPATDRAMFEATRPLLGELVQDTMLCLRYYGVTFRGKPASQIILTGGQCFEPHLAEMLENSCKLPVAFDDEAETLSRLLPGIGSILHRTPGTAATWSVAAGLSIRELAMAVTRRRDDEHDAEPQAMGDDASQRSNQPQRRAA
jgi:type IV pilus assembly protein PilM